jgi:hypothetical protein
MKFLIRIFIFLVLISTPCFANLYLQTEYQEGKRPKIITKHHIFLDKRYTINYTKKSYVLILKKINNNEATIESESYDFDKLGHKTMRGGSFGTYKIGKFFALTDHAANGNQLFSLKIVLEKSVPTKP